MAEGYSNLGTAGVILVDQEYAPTDGSLDTAQNAEMVLDAEKGGDPSLRKRGGYLTLGAVFGSGLTEMVQIRFIASV